MITDSEFIIMDSWKRSNRKFQNEINTLINKIHELVAVANERYDEIQTLKKKIEELNGILNERTDALIIEAESREIEFTKSFYVQTYLKFFARNTNEMLKKSQTDSQPTEIGNVLSKAQMLSSAQTISFLQMRNPELFNSISADELINITAKDQVSEKEND